MQSDSDSQWLTLPLLDNIYQDPADKQPVSIVRKIQLDNFIVIVNFITTEQSRETRLEDLNILENANDNELFIINYLTKYELALLSYHVLHVNQNDLNQQFVDAMLEKLEAHYLPPWKNNQIPIDQGIQEIFLTNVEFEFTHTYQHEIRRILNHNKDKIDPQVYQDLINLLPTSHWPMVMLLELIDQLEILKDEGLIDPVKIHQITDFIEPKLLKEMESKYITIARKTAFGFIIFDWRLRKGEEYLAKARNLLSKLWLDWEDVDNSQYQTLRYSFLAFNAILIDRLFDTSINFFTRRGLVQSLKTKMEMDTQKFAFYLNSVFNRAHIHPWLLKRLINGFKSYTRVMFDYVSILPNSKEREDLLIHLTFATRLFRETMINYFVGQYQLYHPNQDTELFIDQLVIKINPQHMITDVFEFLETTISVSLFLDQDIILHRNNIYLLDLWLKVAQQTKKKELLFLHEIDILLLTKQYPYLAILDQIKREIGKSQTILSSPTFENRIVLIIIQTMQYLSDRFTENIEPDIRAYEILMYFATEWLQVFSTEKSLFAEASSILIIVISICLTNLTKIYFQNKDIEKAFLMYLNTYYFSEFLNAKIFSSDSPANFELKSLAKISSKFDQVSQDWQFNNFMDVDEFKGYAKRIELHLKTESIDQSNLRNTMLDDDLLFSFLDINDAMKEFTEMELNITTSNFDKLKDLRVYTTPEANALTRMGRIGSTLTSENQLPIPLFKNIDRIVAALEFEPIDLFKAEYEDAAILDNIVSLWR